MTTASDDLSLPDRLRLAGFELILQGCPAWLYSAAYEAAAILAAPEEPARGNLGAPPPANMSRRWR